MSPPSVLIVGAGPTGLAAALQLSLRGIRARIVDERTEPAPHSRALAVNPRTLELLEATGVSERMVAEGRRALGVIFHEGGKPLARIEAERIHPRYGLTVLSQARSEALLTDALAERGIAVERGRKAKLLARDPDAARVCLDDDGVGVGSFDVVFAADGAHSAFRDALDIGFPGESYPETWPLFDLPMDTPLDVDHAHVMLFPDGMIFLLAFDPAHWRVISNLPDPLSRLPPGTAVSEPTWTSSFRVAHRVAERCAVGRVALGGDAAHIHSPVGARGLNLGVEDASAFAMYLAAQAGDPIGALARYQRERHPVHEAVVRRIRMVTSLARGGNAALRGLRRAILPTAAHLPLLRRFALRTVMGLDHPPPH
ncbi:FAD-dependent oxidoreductase [Luteibacter sp. CQ10]|uniref:FAD-dependent oxidoreductase n=1 Tax=Luteibacter sp. CQ10 TaxID=2805821 RepID=UPI0034A29687